MFVRSLKEVDLSADLIPGMPVEVRWGRLRSGETVDRRGERFAEIIVGISGTATLTAAADVELRAGDAAHIPATGSGYLAVGGSFEFFSIVWPDRDSTGTAVRVVSLDRGRMFWSYQMDLQELFGSKDMPIGSVFGSVRPHTISKRHNHHDSELFLILAGEAYVEVGEESRKLVAGEVVHLPPFAAHAIRNEADQPFDLVSISWEDIDVAAGVLATRTARDDVAGHTLVFCPPPTPNGGLHVGHAAGPYVRADLYARALRTIGRTAELVTGTDDHQSHVVKAAERLGETPAALARSAGSQIIASLRALDIELGRVYRPRLDPEHEYRTRTLFTAVETASEAYRANVATAYCVVCERSLYQAFVGGSCPHCRRECDGEICEACGHPNDAVRLDGRRCQRCGTPAASRQEPALILDLDKFAAKLRAYLARVKGSGPLRLLAETLVADGLEPYRLTRHGRWGVSVNDPELPGSVLDPWVELALSQLICAEQLASGPNTDSVIFLGLDNTFYYAVLLPALALATGREHLLPTGFVSNAFLHLDGEKFSTSRRHTVEIDDLLRTAPSDVVRLAALRHAPEEDVRDVSRTAISDVTNDPLLSEMRDWLTGFRRLPGAGRVPSTGAWTSAHREFYRRLGECGRFADSLLLVDTFNSNAYLRAVDRLLATARDFRLAETSIRQLTGMPEEARTSLALEFLAAKVMAALVYPVMPQLGAQLWRVLGLPGMPRRQLNPTFVPADTTVTMPELPLTRHTGGHVAGLP